MTFKVGIDLGTTNSVVAYLKNNRPHVVRTLEGIDWTPSMIQNLNNRLIVGKRARDNLGVAPPDTVAWSIKRFIGRMPDDPEMQKAKRLVSYAVEPPLPGSDELTIRLAGKPMTPVELSAEILKHIVAGVERTLRRRPTHAVITVPAWFTERQKAATRRAGELAGLGVLTILDEPSAAALAYNLDLKRETCTVLVFDLGGGTFDVSILMISDGMTCQMRNGGDNFLGGDDFDALIVRELQRHLPAEVRDDALIMAQLKSVAEDSKIALSTEEITAIDKFLRAPNGGPAIQLSTEITRAWFQQASRPLVNRAIAKVHEVLARAQLSAEKIDRVLMVGGSSRLPAVLDSVAAVFGAEKIDCELDGMLCVALGAAIRAEHLDVDPPAALPQQPAQSVPAPIITVTPRNIGVELHDGSFSVLIEEGTVLPVAPRCRPYQTASSGQLEVRLAFYEGQHRSARHNDHINDVVLQLVRPLPRNTPVDITVGLDLSGIMYVTVAVADEVLVRDARIDREIRTHVPEPEADPEQANAAIQNAQRKIATILRVCAPILDDYPAFRDEWQGALSAIERAIETRNSAAGDETLARGARMLARGLPPHLWAFYNGCIFLDRRRLDGGQAKAIADHIQHIRSAAAAKNVKKARAELDELLGEVQSIVDRESPADQNAHGIAIR
jgi:molecular chaperone DnaK